MSDAATATRAASAPRWWPDPWQRHQSRFHDGRQWTEHVADGGRCSIDSTPVVDLPRSRPPDPMGSPTEGLGPRVLPEDVAGDAGIDAPLLLVDDQAGPDGSRRLLRPDETPVGVVRAARASAAVRLLGRLATDGDPQPTRIDVDTADGTRVLTLSRPRRRTAATVDVTGPAGALGTVVATAVRRGLDADVVDPGGTSVGRLVVADATGSMQVVDAADRPLARTTPTWDIPGERWSLPPGVVLVDRRPPDGGDLDPERARLLLGALLSPALLVVR